MTEPTIKPFVFDWQECRDGRDRDGFLKWFLPTVMVGASPGQMEGLTELTSRWSDVRVQVLINGVEVNAEHFLQSVERNLEASARDEARRMLDDVGGLESLEDRIREIRSHLIGEFEKALLERGIELPERDEWGS